MGSTDVGQRPSLSRVLWYVLLGMTLCRVWVGPVGVLPTAYAQIPDSGAQRKQLIDEVRKTNRLLTQLNETLRDQIIKVRIIGADNTSAE